MIVEKAGLEVLALIVVLVLIFLFIRAIRQVNTSIHHMLPPSKEEELAHFDELLHEHEKIRASQVTHDRKD